MSQDRLKIVREWQDGRKLLSTYSGDLYWLAQPDGTKERLSLQQASQLLLDKIDPPMKRTRSKKKKGVEVQPTRSQTAVQLSSDISQETLEEAASYLLLRDPEHRGDFLSVDLVTKEEIKLRAERIREKIDRLDTRLESRLEMAFYLGAAELWRQHLDRLNSGSGVA
jgi:hypothetical protein